NGFLQSLTETSRVQASRQLTLSPAQHARRPGARSLHRYGWRKGGKRSSLVPAKPLPQRRSRSLGLLSRRRTPPSRFVSSLQKFAHPSKWYRRRFLCPAEYRELKAYSFPAKSAFGHQSPKLDPCRQKPEQSFGHG